MPILKLDNSEKPKLIVSTNNSLNYKDTKNGGIKERRADTAAIDAIKEAAATSGLEQGLVIASLYF